MRDVFAIFWAQHIMYQHTSLYEFIVFSALVSKLSISYTSPRRHLTRLTTPTKPLKTQITRKCLFFKAQLCTKLQHRWALDWICISPNLEAIRKDYFWLLSHQPCFSSFSRRRSLTYTPRRFCAEEQNNLPVNKTKTKNNQNKQENVSTF